VVVFYDEEKTLLPPYFLIYLEFPPSKDTAMRL